jgi:hypothetical protein
MFFYIAEVFLMSHYGRDLCWHFCHYCQLQKYCLHYLHWLCFFFCITMKQHFCRRFKSYTQYRTQLWWLSRAPLFPCLPLVCANIRNISSMSGKLFVKSSTTSFSCCIHQKAHIIFHFSHHFFWPTLTTSSDQVLQSHIQLPSL